MIMQYGIKRMLESKDNLRFVKVQFPSNLDAGSEHGRRIDA